MYLLNVMNGENSAIAFHLLLIVYLLSSSLNFSRIIFESIKSPLSFQVKYAPGAHLYATSSRDGSFKVFII